MKRLFLIAMVLLAVSATSAQTNTIVINTSGDVTLRQGNEFSCRGGSYVKTDSVLMLNGSNDYEVTVEELSYLTILSSGDVITENTFHGKDLSVNFNGSGDSRLDLDYDNVYVMMVGSGDLELRGKCNTFDYDHSGSGDLITKRLERTSQSESRAVPSMAGLSELLAELGTNLEMLSDSVDWDQFERDMERWGESMEEWGRHMEEWGNQMERRMEGREKNHGRHENWDKPNHGPKTQPQPEPKPQPKPQKRSLLYDGHWNGFDAGINLMLGPGSAANFEGQYAFLEQRPMKSWVFNFNLADVGIAFSRNHVAGLYTGIGLGWNNYSLNNPVRLYKGQNGIEGEWIDESVEGRVKKSKLGVLYIQAPLMLEINPSHDFFIAAGVTGGFRIDAWTKVKFRDGFKEKHHGDYYVYPLKLDATLRAGGDDMGFFASFDLLPLFDGRTSPDCHTLSFGFSLLF